MKHFFTAGRGLPFGKGERVNMLSRNKIGTGLRYQDRSGRPIDPNNRYMLLHCVSRRIGTRRKDEHEANRNEGIGVTHTAYSLWPKAFIIIFCVLFSGTLAYPAFVQEAKGLNKIKPLKVGDTIPEELWNLPLQVVNHPDGRHTVTLNDYRDRKLIILDFWATWCGACISMFPKTDQLQAEYNEEILILPVTYQKFNEVSNFLKRMSKLNNKLEGLFSVVDNIDFVRFFPHNTLPHYIWIGESGKYLGSSFGAELTATNIKSAISGYLNVDNKIDGFKKVDGKKSFLISSNGYENKNIISYSMIGKYDPEYGAGSISEYDRVIDDRLSKITLTNVSLHSLITTAFSTSDRQLGNNRLEINVKDNSPFKTSVGLSQKDAREWRQKYCLCYEIVSEGDRDTLRNYMRQDLQKYFPQYRIEIRKLIRPVWVLKQHDNIAKIKTKGVPYKSQFSQFGFQLQNASLFELYFFLSNRYQSPVIYEDIDWDQHVDLKVDAELMNGAALHKELIKKGLSLTLENREVDMIVVEDNPSL